MRVEAVRWRDAAPAVVWMAIIFVGSSFPLTGMPGPPSYVAHFIEYAVLGALLAFALRDSDPAVALLLAAGIAVAYGATDEVHQMFVPTRTPDVADWLVDSAGGLVGAGLMLLAFRLSPRRS